MESRVINHIRKYLLSLAIFSHGKLCNKSCEKIYIVIEDIYCLLAIVSHGKSCNKSY